MGISFFETVRNGLALRRGEKVSASQNCFLNMECYHRYGTTIFLFKYLSPARPNSEMMERGHQLSKKKSWIV